MEEKILDILDKSDRALSIEELDKALDIHTVEDTKLFSDSLRALEENYKIYCSNKGRYMLFNFSHP